MARARNRDERLVFLNVGEKYALMGNGFTDLSTSGNASTESKQYVHQSVASGSVTGYAPTTSFTGEVFDSDDAVEYIMNIADNWDIGDKVNTDIVIVDTWKKGSSEKSYIARKQNIVITIDNPGSGAAGSVLGLTGTLQHSGSPIKGEFNTDTLKFTADGSTTPTE